MHEVPKRPMNGSLEGGMNGYPWEIKSKRGGEE